VSAYPPEPPDWQPVIALEHERGTAAVCRDPDGSLWLVWDMEDLSGEGDWDEEPPDDDEDWDPREEFGDELLDHETAGAGTTVDGVAALAGRLPDGATRVEVRDGADRPVPVGVDEEVWLAIPDPTSRVEPVVLFFGDDGSPVRRPLPEHVLVEPLAKVDLECPGCGATGWELASVPTATAGDAEPEFSYEWEPGDRAAVCRTCGYVQALPRRGPTQHIVIEAEKLDPAEQRKRREAHAVSVWRRATAGLGTPPLGLTRDWSGARRLEGWGGALGESDPIRDITLGHSESWPPSGPSLSITTSAERFNDDLYPVERWLEDNLVAALDDHWWDPEGTDDAIGDLREELRRRRVQERVHALPRQRVAVPVDNEPVSFLVIAFADTWCAHGEHHGASITLVASGFPLAQVALEVADVGMYLSR
jgi:hypothetical protein